MSALDLENSMETQQLNHGLYGWPDVQQRHARGLAREMFVDAQECADSGAVEELHAAEVDGHGFGSRSPELLALALEVARRDCIEPWGLHEEVERLVFHFSFNNGRHAHTMGGPVARESSKAFR
jgi:hypothetical protein